MTQHMSATAAMGQVGWRSALGPVRTADPAAALSHAAAKPACHDSQLHFGTQYGPCAQEGALGMEEGATLHHSGRARAASLRILSDQCACGSP